MPHGAISISDDEKWQVEQDVRTLKDAEIIKKDDIRLAKAMSLMGEEAQAMDAAMNAAAKERFKNTEFKS